MRVLVVDDEKRLAAALRTGLTAEGFAVDVALTGDEGLWLATENTYDAIILDIMLPGLNGYEVCRRLRDASDWTPILMLTAKNGEWDETEALDMGADDYLSKPFSFMVLVAHLRALLRRGRPERPVVMHCGDLVVDRSVCRRRGTRSTSRRNRGARVPHGSQAVVSSDIVDHVWDMHFDGDLNVVEVRQRARED